MPIGFEALFIDTADVEGVMRIILSADNTLEAEHYLMFQRDPDPSQQDIALGMDDVHVETCGQGWGWYGHIEDVELSRDHLSVQLDAEAAARMRGTGRIDVTFSISSARFDELRTALRRLLSEQPYYREAAA